MSECVDSKYEDLKAGLQMVREYVEKYAEYKTGISKEQQKESSIQEKTTGIGHS